MPGWFFNAIGLIGPVLFTWAYLQLSLGKWTASMQRTHVLNFTGAALLMISLVHDVNWPAIVLESCWMAVSLYGMWRSSRA